MDSAAPLAVKGRGFRRLRLAAIILLVLPVSALLLGNLILSTPWVCRWAEAKIQNHTGGLDTHISRIALTPWDGISIRDLELLQPIPLRPLLKQPLVHIDTLRITPVWRAWLKGRFVVQSVELDTPRIVIPLELLAHLSQAGATAPPTIAPPQVISSIAGLSPAVPPVVRPPVVRPPATAPNSAASPIAPAPASFPTGWLHLKNGSLTLIHAGSTQVLFAISNTCGAIPISGDSAKSHLTLGSISAGGQPVVSPPKVALDWKSPLLSIGPFESKIGGHSFFITAQLGSLTGLPLQIEAKLAPQKIALLKMPFASQIEAESLTASARFRGLLLSPATWQGDLWLDATFPHLHFAEHDLKFDRGTAITVLRGGLVSCIDARLIADEISVLGNASVLGDGRLAGAARIVAVPETVASAARQAFPSMREAPSLTPLSTPQRAAFDLVASGTINQISLQLGKDGPVVKYKP